MPITLYKSTLRHKKLNKNAAPLEISKQPIQKLALWFIYTSCSFVTNSEYGTEREPLSIYC